LLTLQQHAAAHCNKTLQQHTAAHCNALQQAALKGSDTFMTHAAITRCNITATKHCNNTLQQVALKGSDMFITHAATTCCNILQQHTGKKTL